MWCGIRVLLSGGILWYCGAVQYCSIVVLWCGALLRYCSAVRYCRAGLCDGQGMDNIVVGMVWYCDGQGMDRRQTRRAQTVTAARWTGPVILLKAQTIFWLNLQ